MKKNHPHPTTMIYCENGDNLVKLLCFTMLTHCAELARSIDPCLIWASKAWTAGEHYQHYKRESLHAECQPTMLHSAGWERGEGSAIDTVILLHA